MIFPTRPCVYTVLGQESQAVCGNQGSSLASKKHATPTLFSCQNSLGQNLRETTLFLNRNAISVCLQFQEIFILIFSQQRRVKFCGVMGTAVYPSKHVFRKYCKGNSVTKICQKKFLSARWIK